MSNLNKVDKAFMVLLSMCFITLMFGLGYEAYNQHYKTYHTKYDIGDCVKQTYTNEFYKTYYYHLVLKIGDKSYLTAMTTDGVDGFITKHNVISKFTLNSGKEVKNKFCGAKYGK